MNFRGRAAATDWFATPAMAGRSTAWLRANSAQPVNIVTGNYAFGLVWNNDAVNQRPNVVPNTPLYISGGGCTAANSGSSCPGGRRFNPAHFSAPTDLFAQGNLGRNQLRGFDAVQEDIALRRSFPIHDTVSIEFRAEAFNVLNHPMFGDVGTQSDGRNLINNDFFGISAHSLADSLGSGGADGGSEQSLPDRLAAFDAIRFESEVLS